MVGTITVAALSFVKGVAMRPDASFPMTPTRNTEARAQHRAVHRSARGISKPTLQAKKMRTAHAWTRFTCSRAPG